jgi:tetratricopeptide (TPR) repeat protein
MPLAHKFWLHWLSIFFAFCFVGCDRLVPSRHNQLIQDADNKAARGDFERAINLYEAALDDSPRCAEVHYKLALLYDDKLNDPVSALHHFRRYLTLSPKGNHANDVQNSIRRDELAALTSLSGDSVVTRTEAARLRNENLSLRKQLEARAGTSQSAPGKSQAANTATTKTGARKSGERTYVVRQGDTLASISRKFYKSSARWQQILEANKKSIPNPKRLTVGQTLVIP